MSLAFHFHPLASFCHKALIALYENGTPFSPVIVDFGDPASAEAFRKLWPMAKMPVLRDDARDATVAESSVVIEYLDRHYPGTARLVSDEPDRSWQIRFWDRFFDGYVHHPMQTVVTDNLRPHGARDPFGVEQSKAQIDAAYDYLETQLQSDGWLVGAYSLAECSASPALFYANTVRPIPADRRKCRAYLKRLMQRPSFARALKEAEPYFGMFPLEPKPTRDLPE